MTPTTTTAALDLAVAPVTGDALVTSTTRRVSQAGTCRDMLGWDASFDCAADAPVVNLGADTTRRRSASPLWCEVMGTSPKGHRVALRPLDSHQAFTARNASR